MDNRVYSFLYFCLNIEKFPMRQLRYWRRHRKKSEERAFLLPSLSSRFPFNFFFICNKILIYFLIKIDLISLINQELRCYFLFNRPVYSILSFYLFIYSNIFLYFFSFHFSFFLFFEAIAIARLQQTNYIVICKNKLSNIYSNKYACRIVL